MNLYILNYLIIKVKHINIIDILPLFYLYLKTDNYFENYYYYLRNQMLLANLQMFALVVEHLELEVKLH